MKNAETTATDKAAAVAEQGAPGAPEKAASEGCQPQEERAQGPDSRQGCQNQGRRAEEGSQGREESCQARPHKKGQRAARREQGREDHRDDRKNLATAGVVRFVG